MKRLLLILLLPSVSFGAVTQAQVTQAKTANEKMLACYISMRIYVSNVQSLFDSSFKLSVPGSTSTVTVPQALQDEAIDTSKYQVNKQCFIDAFNTLP